MKYLKNIISSHFLLLVIIIANSTGSSFLHAHPPIESPQCLHNLKEQTVNWENVTYKLANPPSWFIEHIKADLMPFQNTNLNATNINHLMQQSTGPRARFTINNGVLHSQHFPTQNNADWVPRRLNVFTAVLNMLLKHQCINQNADFVMYLFDHINYGHPTLPLFCTVRNEQCNKVILVPDPQTFTLLFNEQTNIQKATKDTPWEQKENALLWRGEPNDCENYRLPMDMPRSKLVALSQAHPTIINASFNGYWGHPHHRFLSKKFGQSTFVSFADHIHYKYLPSLDGSTAAFSSLTWKLLSNSVVIKQDSSDVQWYYHMLKPYEHFIPVKRDISNLLEIINWMQKNDAETRKIAQQACDFANNNLTLEDQLVYLSLLINEYGKLQNKD